MNAETEAVKSVQRLFAESFAPSWAQYFTDPDDTRGSVERAIEQSGAPARPFVLVEQTAQSLMADLGSGRHRLTVPITARVFLPGYATRVEALDAAGEARDVIVSALQVGMEDDRSTPNRIRRYHYSPRVERHLLGVTAIAGEFTISVDRPGSTLGFTTIALPITSTAADVAGELAAELADTGVAIQAGDVVGLDRGQGLWEIRYEGGLAGLRVGKPSIDDAALVGLAGRTATRAEVLLEGAAAPWRSEHDYLRVEALSISPPIPDQDDPRLLMLAVDMRCTLGRGPHLPSNHRIVQRIATHFSPR